MDRVWAEDRLSLIDKKLRTVIERNKGAIPAIAINGHYDNRADMTRTWNADDGLCWWTNGFWGGIMNQMYAFSGFDGYLEEEKTSEELLDGCLPSLFKGLHHDTGFMWLPLSVARYMIDGNEKSEDRGLLAATLLMGRYNPNGYLRAWNDNPETGVNTRGWSIIDSMMNISILYWASTELDDPRFAMVAEKHADTTMRNAVREDGSVRHITEYDAETGKYLREYGGQGYAEGSAWTRGQAWGIYGFANSFCHTGREDFLATSEKIASFFMNHMKEDGHIPVDFLQPEEPHIEDSTAAAIASCGFFELYKHTNKEEYLETAMKMLKALDKDRSDYSPDTDNILQKCTGSYHGTKDREIGFVYADYYYIEALLKIAGKAIEIW